MGSDSEQHHNSSLEDRINPATVSGKTRDESVGRLLEKVKKARFSTGITSWQSLPSVKPRWVDFPEDLHAELAGILNRKNINQLYSHQVEAWQSVRSSSNPVIVTPTASGKTLCYNLPVLNRLLISPESRALYIFPAKALAQDQYHELLQMTREIEPAIRLGIYDGDTPSDMRKSTRETARILLTNPDMVHSGILPHHSRWATFFRNLEFIVIDEVHQYRGVFGSHLCNVLRRLKRICTFHGSNPGFILSSATIANPEELSERLIGEPVHLIDKSGAPAGEKTIIFYNPPVVDFDGMIRRSYIDETIRFARMMIEEDIQTIVFTRSRRNVELILLELQRVLKGIVPASAVQGYRGGYLPRERREIETGLKDGRIRCVVATSALELGVDIGDMGSVVMAGYPGTIASTWQRAGRAGRRDNRAIAVLVASAAPLDQFIVRHPEYFFAHPAEHGLINPDNLLILLAHIRCAAFELPFSDDEKYAGLDETIEFLEYLESSGELQHSSGRWFYSGGDYPAEKVSLRSISAQNIIITTHLAERTEVVGEIDACAAHLLLHPEAVYLHGGRQYLVQILDFENGKAHIQPHDAGYYTAPIEQTHVNILEEKLCSEHACPIHLGDVRVTSRVVGYKKLRFSTQEQLGTGIVKLPEQELMTMGVWYTLPMELPGENRVREFKSLAAGFTGALTAIHNVASVLLMSDPRDLGSCVSGSDNDWSVQMDHLGMLQLSGQPFSATGMVNLFIFDRYPGGIGLSENLFQMSAEVVTGAVNSIRRCECRQGCPGCVGPVNPGVDNIKLEAVEILEFIQRGLVQV